MRRVTSGARNFKPLRKYLRASVCAHELSSSLSRLTRASIRAKTTSSNSASPTPTATTRHAAKAQAIPRAAVTQTLAAVVNPSM